jgi:hypothetical protein
MVPLYVFGMEIYHFCASRLQFTQIINLELIDGESDQRDPLVSVDVAISEGFFAEVD